MSKARVVVQESKIGRAVFADGPIDDETCIGTISGEILEVNDDFHGSSYCIEFGDGRVLEPSAPFRFLNHCCTPNCELIIWTDDDPNDWELALHTIRPIQAGEELTIDYAWPASSAIRCECGSESCRGWIVAETDIDELEERVPELVG